MSDQVEGGRGRAVAPIEFIIGIDYGTRFTKVAVGREGQEPTVWRNGNEKQLIPSIVHIDTDGTVFPWPNNVPAGALKIEYLKMLLAKPDDSIFDFPVPIPAELNKETIVKALAALFLSEIMRRVRESEQAKPHLRNADLRWLVNVGVPVQYFDAPEREVFRQVAAVAFRWQEKPPSVPKVETLTRAYSAELATIDPTTSPTSVFPELAAALTEYIRDPNRPEGLYYGFCDIGGGTIDGAIFRLYRTSGLPRLAILSASVAPYGTAAVARSLAAKVRSNKSADNISALSARIETLLTDHEKLPTSTRELAASLFKTHGGEARDCVQTFVRGFVNEARMKRNVDGYTFADPFTGEKIDLRFFLAGGGAESSWYRSTIQSLDPIENQAFYGVKRLRLETVGRPRHFRGDEFPRFVIALGLTNLPEELEEASRLLPSAIKKKPPPPEREHVRTITKDDV